MGGDKGRRQGEATRETTKGDDRGGDKRRRQRQSGFWFRVVVGAAVRAERSARVNPMHRGKHVDRVTREC